MEPAFIIWKGQSINKFSLLFPEIFIIITNDNLIILFRGLKEEWHMMYTYVNETVGVQYTVGGVDFDKILLANKHFEIVVSIGRQSWTSIEKKFSPHNLLGNAPEKFPNKFFLK
jgi:hypothetical protein